MEERVILETESARALQGSSESRVRKNVPRISMDQIVKVNVIAKMEQRVIQSMEDAIVLLDGLE